MNVFISHAQKDRAIASELAALLSEAGFQVWSPADHIWPGDNWAKKIGKALEVAEFMIVLLTPKALDADWVRQDIQYALTTKKFQGHFFSVLVGPTLASPKDVPWILYKLPHIQIGSKNELGQAVDEIKALTLASARK